jgi:hypothetical protein
MREPRQSELLGLLRDELTRRLGAAGWAVDVAEDTEPGGVMVGVFRRQVTEDFWATIHYLLANWNGAEEVLQICGDVGVSYFPAYCLWPLLVAGERTEMNVDLGELLDPPDAWTIANTMVDPMIVEVQSPADVPEAAEALVEPVLELGVAWAEQHASVDGLLDEYRAGAFRFKGQIESVPMLLAASGRYDEARRELADYLALDRKEVRTREYKRFAYQLNRWLDAGGVVPDPPTEPVMESRDFDFQRPSREESKRESQAKREAMGVVRSQAKGKDRAELREMLKAEFARRGVSERPSALELQLDMIQASDTALGRTLASATALKKLFNIGVGVYKTFHDDEEPTPTPDWLAPPGRASYPARSSIRDWSGVDLEPTAERMLDAIFVSLPPMWKDLARLDAWLDWAPEPEGAQSQLAVHIGNEHVGFVEREQTERFRADMEAAAKRDELPFVEALLHRRNQPPRYVLELQAPPE